ncbi:inner membrane CreD family protein [Kosakonia sp. YIM B13611]|uniref:inner membrane CreD family protein n=1 Tax=unclassified Kosakonia TaxID=2632876 RepID=UPI003698DD05
MRLLLGYFLIVAVAAWFVLSIFVQEIKPGVRRATEGTLIDTATLLAELAREDLRSGHAQDGRLAQAFSTLNHHPINAHISGIHKVRNEYHVYMTDRAVKYAILLIVLTYLAFFVFESLTARQMHPMQYLLVGLSLVMFYLVLLALSEHTGFTIAWGIASLLGALLNGVYLQGVLKSWRAGLSFSIALLVLDAVMWGLLNSEDNALLLGTGVLFIALSAVMVLTRRLDWYALSGSVKKIPQPADDEELRIWK